MGLYVSKEDVRVRLIGKVRFTDDEEEEGKMHTKLLDRLINEAEGQVEHDLSPRYEAPFVTDAGAPFKNLPDRPTKNFLRTLCELMSVIRVLETDFGAGTVVDAEKYAGSLRKRYEEMLDKLMARRTYNGDAFGWKYPPLPGLKLNYMNTEADDGYAGQVLVAGNNDGDYPGTRINDPAESFGTWKPEF